MPNVAVLLADGFEEVEAMAIIDVLRRANVHVRVTGLHEGAVASARGVRVIPDAVIDAIKPKDFDMIVLPGGQPGADNLNADPRVKALLRDFHAEGKLTGAICAAPYVLANAGILHGKRATCYPTYRDKLGNAIYEEAAVVQDATVLTSRGPGTALYFGLAIVEKLVGKETAQRIRESMMVGIDSG